MNQIIIIILVSWFAGLAAWVGGIVAWVDGSAETEKKREITHGVVAFGGGILIAAIAFALIPKGMAILSPLRLAITFCSGGLLFLMVDVYLSRGGGTKAQFMAMLLDFLPEALALGAVFGHDPRLGMLLSAFIGTQNLPEGFNSFREFQGKGAKPHTTLRCFLAISLLGPIAACTGYFFLQDHTRLTAGIMTFASGGIMYLIFQDIAPQSKMKRYWTPALGAVLGFTFGMLGKMLIG